MKQTKATIKTVAILGYGSQGRAIALNLRDSGYDVLIGLKSRSKSRAVAGNDGFKAIHTIAEATEKADVVCFAFPDYLHGRVYRDEIQPAVSAGSTLLFLHGMSVHFGFVAPPPECDVILLAPHAPGGAVREKYVTDQSLSAFYAVSQDASGHALRTVFELAAAIGFLKKRLVATTFEHETLGDMFGEQTVLCGGMARLIKAGFEVLIEKGIPPENAYLEVAFQLDLIVDLIKRHGIEGMLRRISVSARYGSCLSGPEIIDESVKQRMERVFDRIASGDFARQLDSFDSQQASASKKALRAMTHPLLEKAVRKYSS